MEQKKEKRPKGIYLGPWTCLLCGDTWQGTVPEKYYGYILDKWIEKHGDHPQSLPVPDLPEEVEQG